MTNKTLAERSLYEEIRDAFDGDDVVAKNIALKKAADALDAKDREIERLTEALHAAISRPAGVVPDVALAFYDPHHPGLGRMRQP